MEQLEITNTDDVAQSLFEQHKDCAPALAYKFKTRVMSNQDLEDMTQLAYIALWKACKTYNAESGASLFTYAYACIKNALIGFKNDYDKHFNNDISIDAPVGNGEDDDATLKDILSDPTTMDDLINNMHRSALVHGMIEYACSKFKTRKSADIFKYYCSIIECDDALIRTATRFDVSRQWVHTVIDRGFRYAKRYAVTHM